jgi:hypothetical protein
MPLTINKVRLQANKNQGVRIMLRRNNGQSIVEYAVLLGVVIAALLIMQMFIKRGYQGGLKESADKFGEQFSAGGTTIHQNRTMEGNQTITEEVATDATINNFVPAGMGDATGTIAGGAVSLSTRSGATQVATTQTATDAAATERTRTNEYQNTSVQDFNSSKIDF